jgi:hypothetical protein
MRKSITVLVTVVALAAVSPALGYPVDIEVQEGPQDPIGLPEGRCIAVHEIGCMQTFPPCQQIALLDWWETIETACPDVPGDDPAIPNVVVQIQNVCSVERCPLYYVADEETSLTNLDGFIGNCGMGDLQEAFQIDHVGINQPLIFESMNWDNCFEPGEIWEFIIQDYQNTKGLTPVQLASLGIASTSFCDFCSSGSIITPEPATLALLGLGASLGLIRRRRA